MSDDMKRVMIFGTFDLVHDGHRHLLAEAVILGEEVIAVVAQDEHVLELKGHRPNHALEERINLIACESEVSLAVAGDEELGSYHIVLKHQPDIVLFGYDQDELKADFEAWCVDQNCLFNIRQASAYMPDVFKTSFMMETLEEEEVEVL